MAYGHKWVAGVTIGGRRSDDRKVAGVTINGRWSDDMVAGMTTVPDFCGFAKIEHVGKGIKRSPV